MTHTVAIIGLGAMGSTVGATLVAGGATVVTSSTDRSDASLQRAKNAGVRIGGDDDVAKSDIVLSIVPPDRVLDVATRFTDLVAGAAKKPIFVDCNATSPATARRIEAILQAGGCDFVDGGIIGLPAGLNPTGTTIFLSGPSAKAVGALTRYGVRFHVMDGAVGAASALKMCYGGLTKGLIAIASAMITAADNADIKSDLIAEWSRSQANLMAGFRKSIPDMLPKAARWAPEMMEISDFLGEGTRDAAMYELFAEFYQAIAADPGASKSLREI